VCTPPAADIAATREGVGEVGSTRVALRFTTMLVGLAAWSQGPGRAYRPDFRPSRSMSWRGQGYADREGQSLAANRDHTCLPTVRLVAPHRRPGRQLAALVPLGP
jgi:hypothetical protein